MKKFLVLSALIITAMTAFTSCDKKTTGNPLLDEWQTPYGVPPFDKIKAEHYMPAIKEAIKLHNKEIRAIAENNEIPDFQNVVLAFDNSGELLNRVSTVLSLIGSADATPELQKVQEEAIPLLTAHFDEIMMNRKLFDKIETVYENRNVSGFRPIQIRLVERQYDEFLRAGAKLHDSDKETLKRLNRELADFSFRFGKNLLAENSRYVLWIDDEESLEGLPNNVRLTAAELATKLNHKGKWAFTLSPSSMIPFLTSSPRDSLREEIFTAYLNRGNHGDSLDNNEVVKNIVRLRAERAHLLGFKTHADYVLAQTMAKNPKNVYALLDDLWTPALEAAKSELEDLRQLKIKDGKGGDIYPWDWYYYANKIRKSRFNINSEELLPYFSADNVRSGIFLLVNRLYGVTFRPVSLPIYNKECITYEVLDQDGSHLGILYLDLYAREGSKKSGAWCANYRPQSYRDGERVAPIVTIVCNFPQPTKNAPSLLTLDETETFFHEFGHALHSLLSNVPFKGLLRVERDFVELPSQIMENWALDPQMLRSYAIHYNSRSNSSNRGVIPENMIRNITRGREFNQGFALTELLAAAYLDMDIHTLQSGEVDDLGIFEVENLNNRRGLIREIPPRYRYAYFAHIFSGGYSAGYYSYVWSEVLDKDAFEAFVEKKDLFNRKISDRFRKEILARGSMEDGMTLYRNFRGADPKREPMLRARGLASAVITEPAAQETEDAEEDILEEIVF